MAQSRHSTRNVNDATTPKRHRTIERNAAPADPSDPAMPGANDTDAEQPVNADRLINRLQAHEKLAAALNAEADKCTERAAYLVDSGCAALPKTTNDPVLREKILQDILRYRQAPMRRLDYRPFSGERTVCPRCWIMDGRRCTGPIDPNGKFYACLGCGPTKKLTHLHKL